jgi:hypothetical protein
VSERLGFEIADDQLDAGVVTMIDVRDEHRDVLAVGREGVMAPVGPELSLVAGQAGATHDETELTELGFGDLGFTADGVVRHGLPGIVGNLSHQSPDCLRLFDADGELHAPAVKGPEAFVVLKADVRADHHLAVVAAAADAGEELVDEPVSATLSVR